MKSRFLRKTILSAMLLGAVSAFAFSYQYAHPAPEPSQASKYYSSSFYTVLAAPDSEERVLAPVRRVMLSSSGDESANDVMYVEGKEGVKTICLYEAPGEPVYSGELADITVSDPIAPGSEFEVEVSVKNTGDTAWFSHDSECPNHPDVNLGTALDRDRESLFGSDKYAVEGWLQPNRVKMVEEVVYPDETATFRFVSESAWVDKWYKEYFSPVVEDIQWMDEVLAEVEILVGDAEKNTDFAIKNIVERSADSDDFTGDKRIEVDLSKQLMYIFVGDEKIGEFQVSTGKSSTPTPTGTYYVLNRQELRVGGDWPHYHMPNWMGFTSVGHGLHSLPYLANDGGAFWYEALDHIGMPVSHGCIRMLPDDSELLYDFGFVGMEIVIYR